MKILLQLIVFTIGIYQIASHTYGLGTILALVGLFCILMGIHNYKRLEAN